MYSLNNKFELVRNEGRKNEVILCTSGDNIKLIDLKNELIKLHNRNKYIVRPQLIKLKNFL